MGNLFVSPKEKHRRRLFGRLKIYALVIIVIFLFWGIYYLITELSFFKITALEIEGAEKLSHSQVINEIAPKIFKSYRAQLLGLDNFFSWPGGKINIKNPLILNLEIEKDFLRRKVKIRVSERKKYGAWCVEALAPNLSKCSWFDKNGVIFSIKNGSAPEPDGNLIFKIKSDSSDNLSADLFGNLKKILETTINNFSLEDFYFESKSLDLKTKIINGPDLIFNLRFNPEINLDALKEMKRRKDWLSLKLIDLRIPNRIFYK